MQRQGNRVVLAATDLANHLACDHLTSLDRSVALGERPKPRTFPDPMLDVLIERGFEHERAYVEHLRRARPDLRIVELRDMKRGPAEERTISAMQEGADVILQGTLEDDRWTGRPDLLVRVDKSSALGGWSYEVQDTKLAQNTRAGTILQLCLYSELLAAVQEVEPEFMRVIKPGDGFPPESFRVAHYRAYYRFVKDRLLRSVDEPGETRYPLPVAHCDVCRWRGECRDRRRDDDHLCLVAGMQGLHIRELEHQGVDTLESFAQAERALTQRPRSGSRETYEKLHGQARAQFKGRELGRPYHELIDPPPLSEDEPARGLRRLPEPSPADIFFDFEGDHFVDDGGLEYLHGYAYDDGNGSLAFTADWATERASERRAFERFIDFVMVRWADDDGMHIYHFSPYEPSAVKRLMSRYGTREAEVDRLLRAGRFIDLHSITRQGVRASVERYSLKDLEPFHGFDREVELPTASRARRNVEMALELAQPWLINDEDRVLVEGYNRDDCMSTAVLRTWLETLRQEQIDDGHDLPRPELEEGDPSENLAEWTREIRELSDRLIDGVPDDPDARTREQAARWLLAHELEYFRRESKCSFWEFIRHFDLEHEDLLDERHALTGLEFVGEVEGGTKRCPWHRYTLPAQELSVGIGDNLKDSPDRTIGEIASIDQVAGHVDIKKREKARDAHPPSVVKHKRISPKQLAASLTEFARSVADSGIDGDGQFRAARDLLARHPPRLTGDAPERLRITDESAVDAATRIALALDRGVLPVQGPPGTGKTYTGARVIASLVAQGKRVGVTAVSHAVVRNLLAEVVEGAAELGIDLRCVHKTSDDPDFPADGVEETGDNAEALAALNDGAVVGGTAWLWARDDAVEQLDYLFIDEAGQMSLAQALAASRCAHNLILLGDPRQLEQPQQGAHPEGAGTAALDHLLDGHMTIPPERGLFLEKTWRLHPSICDFTSEQFYEPRLSPVGGLERQKIVGDSPFAGSGLHFVPVDHADNQSRSHEETGVIARIVDSLLQPGVAWIDREGTTRDLTLDDILVVAPFNAQVAALKECLPDGARVGTVDKFQGQEAPIVIYSMTSSSAEDAPRGMGFLYSPNRFNVATSRARCACILVASTRALEPECRTPDQMRWANALCRFRDLARPCALPRSPR